MAIPDDIKAVKGAMWVWNTASPANWNTSGATQVSREATAFLLKRNTDVDFYQHPNLGTINIDAAITGQNVTFEVTILGAYQALYDLLTQYRSTSKGFGDPEASSYKLGHPIKSRVKPLVVLGGSNAPSLLIPRPVVVDVGAFTWSPSRTHLEEARLLVTGMFDETLGSDHFVMESTSFPVYA